MRPLGVCLIAIFTWIRAALYATVGLVILGIGHLSTHLMTRMANESMLTTWVTRLGKVLGVGALLIALIYVAVGLGLWALKNWARVLAIVFVTLAFFFGLIGLLRFPTPWHIVRAGIQIAIVVYLMLPDVKRIFNATPA
jgi:uncharacterized membrane protein (DUF2068 family)